MRRLGYDSYGTHGSDGGRDGLAGARLLDPQGSSVRTCCSCSRSRRATRPSSRSSRPEEYAALEHLSWFQSVGGYNAMNATRPQTIAAGLSDSPVGQLAYNELFESFGNGTSLVTPEQVLDPGVAVLVDQHLGRQRPLPLRRGATPGPSRRSATAGPVSRSSRTTSRRSGRWPSATTRTSCTGRSSSDGGHYAALERPGRRHRRPPRPSSATCKPLTASAGSLPASRPVSVSVATICRRLPPVRRTTVRGAGSPGCLRTPGSFGLHPSGGTSGQSFLLRADLRRCGVAATRSAAAERRTGIDRRLDHNERLAERGVPESCTDPHGRHPNEDLITFPLGDPHPWPAPRTRQSPHGTVA